MARHEDYLKTEFAQLTGREALRASPLVLHGVTPTAADTLRMLDIYSVFDLASSRVFANAAHLLRNGSNGASLFFRHGQAPADAVDYTLVDERVDELRFKGINILHGIDEAQAATISTALEVKTVRDLALWPPYQAARAMLDAEYFPESTPGFDPEAPPDLLPKSGEFPTERVFYKTLVIDQILDDGATLQPIEAAEPIDLLPATQADFGFKTIAIGALLTFSQSWFAQGLALGQLLHSVALAPGESTRIAVLDWSRRTFGRRDEALAQTEALSNTMVHGRALSEITKAVATEAQAGFSRTESESEATQLGGGLGVGIGPFTFGGSAAGSSTSSSAMSFASSSGRRNLSASYAQKVIDSTQQNASAVRNRRASVIEEISQAEHEAVSTRVITNYNHMHALSIQYYEVVQIYRVAVQLNEAERCLFIPMKLIDFSKQTNDRKYVFVEKYRSILAAAAITAEAQRQLTTDYEMVEVVPATPKVTPSSVLLNPSSPQAQAAAQEGLSTAANELPPLPLIFSPVSEALRIIEAKGWRVDQVRAISSFIGRNVLRPNRDSVFLPAEVVVTGLTLGLQGNSANQIIVERKSSPPTSFGSTNSVDLPEDIPIVDLVSIKLKTNPPAANVRAKITLALSHFGTRFTLDVPIDLVKGLELQEGIDFSSGRVGEELIAHLEANKLYYSQAIYRSLDTATLALLLSKYKYGDRPVSQLIDPLPITVAGNYLVFRMPAVERESATGNGTGAADQLTDWGKWLEEHGLDRSLIHEEIIPLPSGGVFAEAVLGRFNAAEKLDITRFWNWQDSPIPIQAPEIAPVQLGSRALPDDLKPTEFSQPLVNIVNPTPLPDATGLAAVLTAIANGNMFRDMSGLAATIGLAQAGLTAASEGATAAGQQAGANLVTAAQKQVELAKIAASMVAAAMGMSAPNSGASGSNISAEGAKINHGRSMDARGVGGATSTEDSSDSGGSTGGSGTGSNGSGSGGSGDGGTGGAPTSYEAAGFNRALWGPVGMSGGELLQTAFPGTGSSSPAAPLTGWAAVKQRVVELAKHEYEQVWNKGAKKESQADMRPVLLGYWQEGVGMNRDEILQKYHAQLKKLRDDGKENQIPPALRPLAAKKLSELSEAEKDDLLSKGWFVEVPWSAVFISCIMQRAGAGKKFRRAQKHTTYMAAAKENREDKDIDNPFWAYRWDEVQPAAGDIVVKSRKEPNDQNPDYATWEDFEGKISHGDIVIEVGKNKIKVVGGNVNNNVDVKEYDLDANGKLISTGGRNGDPFAIVKFQTGVVV